MARAWGSATVAVTGVDGAISRGGDSRAAAVMRPRVSGRERRSITKMDIMRVSYLIGADLAQLNRINLRGWRTAGEITGFSGNQVILPDRFTSKYGIEEEIILHWK